MLPLRLPAEATATLQVEVEAMEVEVGDEEEVAEEEGLTIRAGEQGRELGKGWESSSQKLLDS